MLLRFADCELDTEGRTLRRAGSLIDVDPKAFDLLVVLARSAGQLVARESIVAALWRDVVVGDAAISQCVRRARVAIGDRDRSARLIETVYGHGLRLTAALTQNVSEVVAAGGGRRGHLSIVRPRDALDASDRPAPTPDSRAAAATNFVGRTAELARLGAAFDAACDGRARILLVAGEPGIGKTRLAEEFLANCVQRGARVAWGRCHEDADAPAYWPWAQAMRPLVEASEPDALRAALGRDVALLAKAIPALRDHIDVADDTSAPADSYALYDPWTRLLASLAQRAPIVIALDDLQWADEGTLLLLRFVAREQPAAPLVVVGTFRDVDPRDRTGAPTSVPERAGVREVIALGALSHGELATLAGVEASAPSVARLHERTGGNAFFAVEILAAHGAPDRLTQGAAPQSVRGFVADRVARLAAPVRQLLAAAAVIGEEVSPLLLPRVANLRSGASEALREAVASGLLRPSGAQDLRFAHTLVREAFYAGLPDLECATLHERVARVVETEYGENLEPHVELLARHYGAAVDLSARAAAEPGARLTQRAADYAQRAARRAAAIASWEESARHAERALAWLAPQSPLGGGTGPLGRRTGQRLDLLVVLGEAQMQSGATTAGHATLRKAAALARARDTWAPLARIAFASVGRFGRSLSAEEPEALALLDAVIASASGDDAALEARVVTRRALVYKPALDEPVKRALLDRAERLARSAADDGVLSYALWARHLASWDPRELPQRRDLSRELLALGTRSHDVEIEALARICGIRDAIDAGDLPALAASIDAYAAMVDRVLHPVVRFYLTPRRVTCAVLEGRIADAEQILFAGLQAPDAHGVRAQLFDPLPLQLVLLRREQGRLGEMADAVDHVAATNDRIPFVIGLQGMARAALGQLDRARTHLHDLAARDFDDVPFDHNRLMVLAEAAYLCAELGDALLAQRLYELLRPFDGHHVVVADGLGYLDAVARPLGVLAAVRGDAAAAIAHQGDAVRTYRAIGARARLAHAEADLARTLARAGAEPDRAASLLASAARAAQQLGLGGLAAAIAAR
jgi:DNA-binding winged helix-turn-helix (wHTH) protein